MAELDNKLDATVRTSFGKGAARKIRAAGEIPAVIYGHGTDPKHINLPGHQTMLLLRKANALLELNIEGDEQLALVKDVQRDPVRQIIEHVDLILVRKGERVEVEVPVHVVGESFSGTIVLQDASTVLVSAEATHIPENIEVNVEGLQDGTTILATDLELPKGTKLVDEEAEIVILTVTEPQEAPEPEEDAEATADAPAEEDAE
ncbi:50S ribosomal protein L25/general stress protein Ctc [Gulosibacter macacae]|uniref:Large ribosomal subunit protein bL25 n=1 Tax=Gulosibacter macacae TaxID=2488791 RepID=A0A3P3VVB0_9MICO|nr:50S ribosomal protein L25/general stress protein Ctc [Gulosibacter macacae]RRJ86394.1 50S ribosomal protein L25/general stress protein Ctc [Gulosibacter macacae]